MYNSKKNMRGCACRRTLSPLASALRQFVCDAARGIPALALALCTLALAVCGPAFAQEQAGHEHAVPAKAKPAAALTTGYGTWHHPVSTKNAQAQAFFDQGLRQIYAFNHDEAARSFQRAGDLDPKLAMAFWGVAEAVGPNYNDPASDDRFGA